MKSFGLLVLRWRVGVEAKGEGEGSEGGGEGGSSGKVATKDSCAESRVDSGEELVEI